ncbi:MAG: HD domain-containing protein, partial [Pseudomonadota bacterium]
MKGATDRSREAEVPDGTRRPLKDLFKEVAPAAAKLGLRVYLVGGAVRDLLGKSGFSGEWDIVVFGGGDEGARNLAALILEIRGGGVPVSFPRFGTSLVPGDSCRIEFAQAHMRSHLESFSPDPLVADAMARDFTLNALYVEITGAGLTEKVTVLDPGGQGLEDLDQGRLRTPVKAIMTFEDDPLRIFRAARLRACHSYSIDPSIGKAAKSSTALVAGIAPERVLDEMKLILLSSRPSLGLELLGRWNAFGPVMPEIQKMVGFKQDNPYHFPDLFRHTLRVVDRCPADLPLRWAALLHDCGKPDARTVTGGSECYHGHEAVGSELAANMLKRLKAGKKLTREVSDLVNLHMVHYQDEWSDRAVRRFIHRAGIHLERLLALVEAD